MAEAKANIRQFLAIGGGTDVFLFHKSLPDKNPTIVKREREFLMVSDDLTP
jgi:hypothetical protein